MGKTTVNEITTARDFDRLTKRRQQVATTLQHLAKEQREMEQNTDWLDREAFDNRVNLRTGVRLAILA